MEITLRELEHALDEGTVSYLEYLAMAGFWMETVEHVEATGEYRDIG